MNNNKMKNVLVFFFSLKGFYGFGFSSILLLVSSQSIFFLIVFDDIKSLKS